MIILLVKASKYAKLSIFEFISIMRALFKKEWFLSPMAGDIVKPHIIV